MTVDELLAQLNDITVPTEPGWWPPAEGWWYVSALIAFLILTLWFLNRRRIANRSFVMASKELEQIKQHYLRDKDATRLALDLSTWLKRVALYAFPGKPLAGLTGQRWLEFLDQSSNDNAFTLGPGRVLGDEIYSPTVTVDVAGLIDLCERWLVQIKPQLAERELG